MGNITKAERERRAAETSSKPALVRMVRDDGMKADVHPDEVQNYLKGPWRIAEG